MPYSSQSHLLAPRRLLRALLLGCLVGGSALSAVPTASAGEYRVFTCRAPTWEVVSGADWKAESGFDGPAAENKCHSDGHMYLGFGFAQRSTRAWSGFGLHLPDGVLAKRIVADRGYMLLGGSVDHGGAYHYELVAGSGWGEADVTSLEWCRQAISACSNVAWDNPSPGGTARVERSFSPGVRFIGFQLACRGVADGACSGGQNGRAHLRINSADLTLVDDTAPQAGALQGTLVQSGPRRGTDTLSFAVSDRGAGVYQAALLVDGKEIVRQHPDGAASCRDAGFLHDTDLEFTRVQPCATAGLATFSVDTTALAEGKHRLEVRVRDAAGNVASGAAHDFDVDNVPPPAASVRPTVVGEAIATGLRPGDAITALNGIWTGASIAFAQRWQRSTPAGTWVDIPNAVGGTYRVGVDDVDRQLRVVVTGSNAEGANESASEATPVVKSGRSVSVQSVKPDETPAAPAPGGGPVNGGGGNPSTGQLVVDREQRTVEVKHGAKVVITGRLVDADGQPIANASVDVFEQIAVTAAAWTKVETIRTDSQGGYVYRPKTTASRRLRFAFSDKREGADYRATRDVLVSVTAAMTIKAKSRTVARRGLIRVSGRVVVDRLPQRGAWVEVQVLDAGVWRTVATRRVAADGKWTFKHRLRGAAATRFTFRARLRIAGDIASAEARSAPLKVRVK